MAEFIIKIRGTTIVEADSAEEALDKFLEMLPENFIDVGSIDCDEMGSEENAKSN